MSVQTDIGPNAPPRWRVHLAAREVLVQAQIALELSADGPRTDLPRALAALDRARAILGTQAAE
jgi:hypothetical protein